MTITIPEDLTYGTVTGRFLIPYSDGSDAGLELDWVAAKGTVLFTPSASVIVDPINKLTFMPATIECTLDSEGYLIGQDLGRGVRLLATDIEGVNPANWTWRVDFRLTDQTDTPTRGIGSFSFEVLVGQTVDLTTIAPIPTGNGTYYSANGPQGEPGAPGKSAYEVAVLEGFEGTEAQWLESLNGSSTYEIAIGNGFVGTEQDWLDSLVGATGTQGPQGPPGSSTGDSAYTVALQNGFIGTETEWLESLVGPEGPQGPQGETGPQGAPGDRGVQGPQGKSGYDEYVQIEQSYGRTPLGLEAWSNLHYGLNAYEVYRIGKSNPLTQEEWLASLNGRNGVDGAQGPAGPRGIAGPSGQSCSLTIDDAIMVGPDEPLTVEILGFAPEQALRFEIPRGPKGDKGEDGVSDVPGLSAYEVAVANGYQDDEDTWLYSLQGATGEPGLNGSNGVTGETKNYVLNGGFEIWQRGTTFTANRAQKIRTADAWCLADLSNTVGKTTKVSKSPLVPTGTGPMSSMLIEWDENYPLLYNEIPGEDCNFLPGIGNENRRLWVSFYAKNPSGTIVNLDLSATLNLVNASGSTLSNGSGVGQITSIGNGWYKVKAFLNLAEMTDTERQSIAMGKLIIGYDVSVGAKKLHIAGVKLEISPEDGYEPIGFTRKNSSYQNELMECQRYFVRLKASTIGSSYAMGFQPTTTSAVAQLALPVEMAAVPTIISPLTGIQWSDFTTTTNTNLGAFAVKPGSSKQTLTLTASWNTAAGSAFRPGAFRSSTTTSYIDLSCEAAIA